MNQSGISARTKSGLIGASMGALLAALGSGKASAATISSLYGTSATSTGNSLSDVTISGILSQAATTNTVVLEDSTGSVLVYKLSTTILPTPVVGTSYNITGATNSPYDGGPELTSTGTYALDTTDPATVVTYPVVTATQVNGSVGATYALTPLSESIVTLDDVTLSTSATNPALSPTTLATNTSYYATDTTGTTEIYIYTSDSSVATAVTAANTLNTATGLYSGPVNIVGYVDPYIYQSNDLAELYPLSITAVPEPASLTLIGLSTAAMMIRRRRA